jgi:hypothetical protein
MIAALGDVAAMTAAGLPIDPMVTDAAATGAEAAASETRRPTTGPEGDAILRNEPK